MLQYNSLQTKTEESLTCSCESAPMLSGRASKSMQLSSFSTFSCPKPAKMASGSSLREEQSVKSSCSSSESSPTAAGMVSRDEQRARMTSVS